MLVLTCNKIYIYQKFRRSGPIEVDPNSAIGGLLSNYPANPTQHPEFNKISSQLNDVIAFVNPKSGGQKGRVIYERLKNYLKKEQIFDLTKGGPKAGYVIAVFVLWCIHNFYL
jgi:hypothetical protein